MDISNTDILKYLKENRIIDITDIQNMIEMRKTQEYLNKHPYSIWKGEKDKKWYTYLPDTTKERRKKLIKRSNKDAVERVVVDYWKAHEHKKDIITFCDAYYLWRKKHDELVSENTVAKYDSDYKRFFKDQEFSDMRLEHITDDDIKLFMCKTVKRLGLKRESTRKLFGYITNTIYTARKYKIITDNPVEFIQVSEFYQYCKQVYKAIDEQIISQEDMYKLQVQFMKDHKKNPYYMPTYAVELASLTGMRAGELSALRWDKITDEYIIIDSSEKANPKKNEFYIGKTKNGKIRYFPIDAEIRKLLETVETVQRECGYDCEWVFANEKGRIHGKTISECIKTKCRQVGIPERGIYALRKTFNSGMRCNGVSSVVASELLGHSPETNTKYYTFDNTDLKEKNKIVSEVNARTRKVTRGNTTTSVSNF